MKKIIGISILLVGLTALLFYVERLQDGKNPNAARTRMPATTTSARISSSADWLSDAITINELMSESDLVVRARVFNVPITRVVRGELPVWDEQGKIVGSVVSEVLFSDTLFEVLETYMGTPLSTITIMQTGGYEPTVSKGIEEMADDPLYKIGEVYVLFLVDISGDHVHAPNRALYRIVNPFGRYRVDDTNVVTYGQNPLRLIQLPTKLLELETQIEQAKGNFVK
ncbi:MAG: hypothetical protein ACOYZ6_17320 [Chloroflexota bacterium]